MSLSMILCNKEAIRILTKWILALLLLLYMLSIIHISIDMSIIQYVMLILGYNGRCMRAIAIVSLAMITVTMVAVTAIAISMISIG